MTFEDMGEELDWDEEFANDLIGRTLLVGLTFLEADGSLIERQQAFGTVTACHPVDGITLELDGSDETFVVAPILEAIEPAEPGTYQLADDEEAIEDPDYTMLLTVMKPALS